MGKKGKKDKSTTDIKDNPDICIATGDFTLPNGDKYSGEYCAHRAGLIWRQGKGIYTSHEGHVYDGNWVDDKLQENAEVVINYSNGIAFHGRLLKDRYSGPGIYTFSNGLDISCEFNGNKPTGEIALIDFNGILWRGKAEQERAVLLPENIFYLTISNQQGIGILKDEFLEDSNDRLDLEGEEEEEEYSDEYWRRIIFAKNQFIKNDVKFGDSKWFKDYEKFSKRKREIEMKIKRNQMLNCQDQLWLAKFREFKDQIIQRDAEKEFERWKRERELFDLNRKFRSPEFLNSSPEVQVIKPTFQTVIIDEKVSKTSFGSGSSSEQEIDQMEKPIEKLKKFNLSMPELDKFARTLERLSSDETKFTEKPSIKEKEKKTRLHFNSERRSKILLPRINLLVHEKLFEDDEETKMIVDLKNTVMEGELAVEEEESKVLIDEEDGKKEVVTEKPVEEEVLTEQQKRIKSYIESKVNEWEQDDDQIDQTSITIQKTPHMHSIGYHTNEINDIPKRVLIDMFRK